MSMHQDVSRQRKIQSHEECGPVDAMETVNDQRSNPRLNTIALHLPNNIFPDHMDICGPHRVVLLPGREWVSGSSEIVHERVQPNINCLGVITGDRDAPGEPLSWP